LNTALRFDLASSRILMTADAVGGVWSYSIDLARALCSRGASVLLATFGPRPSKEQRCESQAIGRLRLVEGDFPLEWTAGASEDAIAAGGSWLLGVARAFAPDIVHLNGYCYAALPWQAPTIVAAHSDVYSWWDVTYGSVPPTEWQPYHHRVSAGLAASDAIVVPSQAMLGALSRHYPVNQQKAEVIHNFTGLQAVFAPKRNIVLGAGRLWDRSKNFSILNKVAERCAWPIQLAGCMHELETSMFNRVTLVGELGRQQMAEALGSAAILVHPSLYEPFGLSVLEAAQSGCALVLSDIASLRELWPAAALFADPHDPGDWIDKINSLIADKALRSEYAQRALARSAHFSIEKAGSSYADLYLALTNGAGFKSRVS
jgi:glycosyltransferase involved in cell wall biosynthesis